VKQSPTAYEEPTVKLPEIKSSKIRKIKKISQNDDYVDDKMKKYPKVILKPKPQDSESMRQLSASQALIE